MIIKHNLNFSYQLICWQKKHGRHHLPWQKTRDPYAIWLSEIMLQQTQVNTVIPYYKRFLQYFPDIKSLSLATLDEVLALWSGLGYYTRGRNLRETARLIVKNNKGKFPCKNNIIKQLPGIGRSTAAAIMVFAYGKRYAILDGNVKRILLRYFGIESYQGEKKTEEFLWEKAEELLPECKVKGEIEAYSQGLMDLGSTICTSRKPKCFLCPIQKDCIAFQENKVDKLPVIKKRKSLVIKETVLLMISSQNKILLERRPLQGIWGGLWCFPEIPVNENISLYCKKTYGINILKLAYIQSIDHTFTHFKMRIHLRSILTESRSLVIKKNDSKFIPIKHTSELGIPAPIRNVLNSTYK